MSPSHLPSIQMRLLSPLFGLLLGLAVSFAYFSWSFHKEYSGLSDNIEINSEVSRHIIEVMRQRARMQEVLLLFRFSGDATYLTELTSLNANRSAHLERIKLHAYRRPTLRTLSTSLAGGLDEATYLQSEMVRAVQAKDFSRADEAFRQLSMIFEINSARIKDFSRRLEGDLSMNEHAMQQLLNQIFWLLGAAVALAALTIGLIAIFYRRSVLRPLQELHRGLRTLAGGQTRSQLALEPAPRELHEMMAGFNQMVLALETGQRQLTEAREEALRAARIKSDFLSNMSHEIRTPMNAIIGMADMLAEGDLSLEKQKYLQILRNSSQILLNVVNDILDYSRLESGSITLESIPFDLAELVSRVSEVVEVMADKKHLDFSYAIRPSEACWVQGDAKRIEQIILNLLGNAVKFTDSGRITFEVDVIAHSDSDRVSIQFSVTDTGIGIAKDDLQRLFNRFTQSDSSITRRYGGTGLGLAIVRQLLDIMGGQVSVTSETGRGSEFQVAFALPRAEAVVVIPSAVDIATFARETSLGRVLLVDDSPDNRLLIQAYLKKTPCAIETAADGSQAIEHFKQKNFDLILMDMQMPVLDGYAATARIRELEAELNRGHTPIIALTAYAMSAEVDRSLKAGCDAHLTKPIRRDDLLKTIHQLM